jgi:hypothetical protein
MNLRTSVGMFLLVGFLIGRGICTDYPETDAQSLLSRASEQVAIKTPASASFMLLAKVQLHDGDKSVDGVYAIAWAPGRFRRVFRFPNFSETDVMVNGVIYRQRTTSALPLMIYELDNLIDSLTTVKPDSKAKLMKIDKTSSDLLCVSLERDVTKAKICVNSGTSLPVSIDKRLNAFGLESLQEHYEFADYQGFGSKQFPRTLNFRGWNSRSIQVQIDKLVRVESFPADEFVPPAGATRMQFCETPETTGEVRPSTGNAIPIGLRDTEVAMYFQVSSLGGVKNAEVVSSTNPLKNKEILNWFVGTHFPVRSCAGQPIEYETIVILDVGH